MGSNNPKFLLKLKKIDAVRSMLDTAIILFFEDADPISVHLLANASRDLLKALEKHHSVYGINTKMDDMIKPEHKKDFYKKIREDYNFVKHADEDPGSEIEFNILKNEAYLMLCCNSFVSLTGETSQNMILFMFYMINKIPDMATKEFWNSEAAVKFKCYRMIFENKKNIFIALRERKDLSKMNSLELENLAKDAELRY